jgi:hypothetical protein
MIQLEPRVKKVKKEPEVFRTGISIDKDIWIKFKTKCALKEVKQSKMIEELLKNWVEGE